VRTGIPPADGFDRKEGSHHRAVRPEAGASVSDGFDPKKGSRRRGPSVYVFAFDRDHTVDVSPHPDRRTVPLSWVVLDPDG